MCAIKCYKPPFSSGSCGVLSKFSQDQGTRALLGQICSGGCGTMDWAVDVQAARRALAVEKLQPRTHDTKPLMWS